MFVSVDEAHVQSSAPVTQTDSTISTNHQNNQNNEAPPPAPAPTKHGKKQKSETNKGTWRLLIQCFYSSTQNGEYSQI